MHCPENNLNLRIKTEPVTPGAEATKYVWHLCVHLHNLHILYSYNWHRNKPDINRCNCDSRDILLYFNADIQIIFGTV